MNPQLDEEALKATLNKVSGWVTANNGEMIKTDIWGTRRLAYPIKGLRDGQYAVLQFKMDPKATKPLEQNLKMTEEIVRYLLVKLDED